MFFKIPDLNYIEVEQTASTNDYTSMLLNKQNIAEGAVVTTLNQSNGRGQRGNIWESEAGKNIALSMVFEPLFLPIEKQFLLSKAVALGVRNFVEQFIPKKHTVAVKWPNDIYVNDKKIAGILIENTLCGINISHAIVGIGVNVNQIKFSSNAPNPVSLAMVAGKIFNIEQLRPVLCEQVWEKYLMIKLDHEQQINNEYIQHLYKYNAYTNYLYQGKAIEAKIIGIEQSGMIVLQQKNGTSAAYDFSQLKLLL